MSFVASPLFPLTLLRLRFTLRTETPLRLGGWQAGSHLRGALLQVMNRTTCALSPLPFEQRNRVDPQHTANCPVCWLVLSDEQPGHERRGYALAPTLSQQPVLKKGDTFSFFLTLFGKAIRYFPYFVMAVQEMGHIGVGPGRGRFHLLSIHADHTPLLDGISAREWEVLTLPENVLRSPQHYLNHAEVEQYAHEWLNGLDAEPLHLRVEFLTPMRLIWKDKLVKQPHFDVFFSRLLERLDRLAVQQSGASPRPLAERIHLHNQAAMVKLIEDHTEWIEVQSGSSRLGRATWISGLVGSVLYSAPHSVWKELLPWLIWGTLTQVGKDVVKGSGVFRLKKENQDERS